MRGGQTRRNIGEEGREIDADTQRLKRRAGHFHAATLAIAGVAGLFWLLVALRARERWSSLRRMAVTRQRMADQAQVGGRPGPGVPATKVDEAGE